MYLERQREIGKVRLVSYLRAQIEIAEDELKNYYENQKSEFQQLEQAKARHISVKTEEEAKAVQKNLKKGKALVESRSLVIAAIITVPL